MDSGATQWNDWHWQMRHRIDSVDALRAACPDAHIPATKPQSLPMSVTPYYASVIRQAASPDRLLRMVLPTAAETVSPDFLGDDPHAEDRFMPVPGLVHRYCDRALLIVTAECAGQCRHCMRKRVWAGDGRVPHLDLPQAARYLAAHPEIRDVLLSGGDPLCLETTQLTEILEAVRAIPSVELIRIGTRVPVALPMRVDDALIRDLRRFHPLYVNTHFNHPSELTPTAVGACGRLADAGIPLGNQSVLLRGVNDDVETLEGLFRALLRARVKPYYLFQCDLVSGVEHFRTPLAAGLGIMGDLRRRLGGMGIPTFALDLPGRGSKVPLQPDYICARDENSTTFRDTSGEIFVYPEPVDA